MKIQFGTFDPQTASTSCWDNYLTLIQDIQLQSDPDDPPIDRESNKKLIKTFSQNTKFNHYFYTLSDEEKGVLIGFARIIVENESSPSYENNHHIATVNMLGIAREYQRRGLATQLFKYSFAEVLKVESHVTEFMLGSFNVSGEKFIENLGGELIDQRVDNRLFMDKLNWQEFEVWLSAAAKAVQKVHFHTVDRIPDEILENYSSLYTEVFNQSPFGTSTWRITETPETIRMREHLLENSGRTLVTIYSQEDDGNISGLTEIIYNPQTPFKIMQLLTGVKHQYRGRKLGRILKTKMLLFIREHYPDAKYILTQNSCENAAMLKINIDMGFREYRKVKTYKISVR